MPETNTNFDDLARLLDRLEQILDRVEERLEEATQVTATAPLQQAFLSDDLTQPRDLFKVPSFEISSES